MQRTPRRCARPRARRRPRCVSSSAAASRSLAVTTCACARSASCAPRARMRAASSRPAASTRSASGAAEAAIACASASISSTAAKSGRSSAASDSPGRAGTPRPPEGGPGGVPNLRKRCSRSASGAIWRQHAALQAHVASAQPPSSRCGSSAARPGLRRRGLPHPRAQRPLELRGAVAPGRIVVDGQRSQASNQLFRFAFGRRSAASGATLWRLLIRCVWRAMEYLIPIPCPSLGFDGGYGLQHHPADASAHPRCSAWGPRCRCAGWSGACGGREPQQFRAFLVGTSSKAAYACPTAPSRAGSRDRRRRRPRPRTGAHVRRHDRDGQRRSAPRRVAQHARRRMRVAPVRCLVDEEYAAVTGHRRAVAPDPASARRPPVELGALHGVTMRPRQRSSSRRRLRHGAHRRADPPSSPIAPS